MKKLYLNRLKKLADYLATNVPDENFDFQWIINGNAFKLREIAEGKPVEWSCGTTACAIGWCPVVFPKHWEVFIKLGGTYIRLKDG